MDVLEGSSLKFSGQIYVNKNTNFGYFAMNTTDVRSKLADIIHMLNVNRKKKRISGPSSCADSPTTMVLGYYLYAHAI